MYACREIWKAIKSVIRKVFGDEKVMKCAFGGWWGFWDRMKWDEVGKIMGWTIVIVLIFCKLNVKCWKGFKMQIYFKIMTFSPSPEVSILYTGIVKNWTNFVIPAPKLLALRRFAFTRNMWHRNQADFVALAANGFCRTVITNQNSDTFAHEKDLFKEMSVFLLQFWVKRWNHTEFVLLFLLKFTPVWTF